MRVAVKLEAVSPSLPFFVTLKSRPFYLDRIPSSTKFLFKKKRSFFSRETPLTKVESSRQNGGDSDYPSLAHNTKSLQQQRHCSKPGIDRFSRSSNPIISSSRGIQRPHERKGSTSRFLKTTMYACKE